MSRPLWTARLSQFFAFLALAVLAAWPVFTHGPVTTVDGPNHFYRLVELSWHVQHGDLFPRWFSDINYGLGGPLFNYYAPLSYYVPLVLHLVGLPLPTAFLLAFALAVGVAAFGAFAWASSQFKSSLAGLVASAAYVLSPYLYYNLLIRGALPEAWGLALAPWLLWSAWRVVNRPSRASYLALTLFYAALILTHSLSALLFTPILLVYVLSLLGAPSRATLETWVRLAGALGLALGLSAFFLLPFFLENGYINLGRATLDYTAAFIAPADLFAWPIPFDPYLARNPYPISLSLPALLLAVGGLLAFLWLRRRSPGATATAFWVLLLGYAACALSLSLPLWNVLPLGRLVQFPWRLLGPASLLLAWLAGLAVTAIANRWVWAGLLATLFLFTLAWTFVSPASSQYPINASPADVIQYEINTPVGIGLTYQQEFLPIWAEQTPTPDDALARYTADLIPSRLTQLPAGFTLISQSNGLTQGQYTYQSTSAVALDFAIAYFPGWTATVDGQPLAIVPNAPQGHVSLVAPAGEHTLSLSLRPTPVQLIGNVLSLLTLVVVTILWFRVAAASQAPVVNVPTLSWGWGALFLVLLLLRVGILDRVETPLYHTQLNSVPNPPAQAVHFGDQLALIGADLTPAQNLAADQPISVTLYWQALGDLTTDYHVSMQLVDDHGNRFGQSDQYPGYVPTGGWLAGQYLPDTHTWLAQEGTPPGTYHLRVSVYAIQNNVAAPLPVTVGDSGAGVDYEAGTITLAAGWLGHPGPLQILEANPTTHSLSVGDALPFSLAWQTGPTALTDLQAELRLTNASGVVYSTHFDPTDQSYPVTKWQPNQLIRFPHSLILPPNLPAGSVQATLTFTDSAGALVAPPFALGTFTISVPERFFTIPAITHRLDYDFGGAIRLLGYNATSDALVLYWQAKQVVTTRYTVFVHNLDTSGTFIGGQDSAPTRATTSWLPGEVITDMRPPLTGAQFEVGLYDPVTGNRLGDSLTINPNP